MLKVIKEPSKVLRRKAMAVQEQPNSAVNAAKWMIDGRKFCD